ALDQTEPHGVFGDDEYDRAGRGCRCCSEYCGETSTRNDGADPSANQFGGQLGQPIELIFCPAKEKRNVVAFDIAGLAKTLAKPAQTVRHRVGQPRVEESNHRHRRLLRTRGDWPRTRRAAEQRHELASSHSIRSSASNGIELGTSMRSALDVCMLITNSNLVDCNPGRSAGFAPLRI